MQSTLSNYPRGQRYDRVVHTPVPASGPRAPLRAVTGLVLLAALLAGLDVRAETFRVVDQSGAAVESAVLWPGETGASPFAGNAEAAASGQASAADRQVIIDQRGKRFAPFISVAPAGSLASFPNSDNVRHHLYSFSKGNAFERKLYQADGAEPVRFENTGVVALGCNIHDNMEAYVLVTDRNDYVLSDADGLAQLAPGQNGSIGIWHPLLSETLLIPPTSITAGDNGVMTVTLPFLWSDPQAPRGRNELESLLKQFSRDAE